MTSVFTRFGLAVAISATLATTSVAKEYAFGAIAIDAQKVDKDPAYGIGGGDTEAEANENAIKFCKEADGKACKTVVTYPECGAYAAGTKGGGWGLSGTKKTAETQALAGCNEDTCKVVVSDCN